MAGTKKRYEYLTMVRAFACFCIVVLHCMKYSCALGQKGVFQMSSAMLTASQIIEYLMNWAVPCFVMVTGALLLDNEKKLTYKKIFSKYIPRMLASILVFSIIFELIDTILLGDPIGLQALVTGIKNAAFNRSWIHMWYLYMVIAIYLMLPIYRKITANINKKDMIYLLVLYGIFLIGVDVLTNGIGASLVMMKQDSYGASELVSTLNSAKSPAFFIFTQKVWPLYLFLGYAIHKEMIKLRPAVSVGVLLAGIVSIIGLGVAGSTLQNPTAVMVCNVLCTFNSSPVYLLMAMGIFSSFHSMKEGKSGVLKTCIGQFDACSFGIYLLHLIPIRIFMVKLHFDPYQYGGLLGAFAFSIAVCVLSFGSTWLLKKIPLAQKII